MNILIVDDIIINRSVLKGMLKNMGHSYFEANNGKEAVDALAVKQFELVLLDIEMPVMNGLETIRYIRTKFPKPICDIKIIALTAYNPSTVDFDFSNEGFNAYLIKPYTMERLQYIIDSVFGVV